MIEIKIYHRDELINITINDEDSTHACIMKDGEDTLGIAGIKYVQEEIELIFTEMNVEDEFLFDGLVKTIVNYAYAKNFINLVVYDEDTINYLKEKDISINNNSINIVEFQNKTHCRKV